MSDLRWKEFYFVDVFDIRKGFYNKKPPCHISGNVPFIGASDSNNGITGFTTYSDIKASSKVGYGPNEPFEKKIFPGRAICVTNNGSVGYAYYVESDFTCTHDVNPLYLHNRELNRYIALFLIACIEKQRVCFEYARKWRPMRMIKSKLLLPVLDGEIAWGFMESYMRKKETEILKPTIERLCIRLISNDITGGGNCIHPHWKPFPLSDIFVILSGKRLTKNDMVCGNRPFIGASDSNNGVTAWVDNSNDSLDSNVLGVNYNGSVCETFYHPYECIFSDDVKRLHLKNGLDSKYIYLFMKTLILQQKCKYEYGYKFNEQRMLRQTILLPVDETGKPDWNFMETFMRKLETRLLETTVEVFKKRINVNKCKLGGGKMETSSSSFSV